MRIPLLTLFLICLTAWSELTLAQDASATKEPVATKAEKSTKKAASLSLKQADEAIAFARQHHPELADLLTQLRDSNPKEFKRGIREVHRTVQRLERWREKQPTRYAEQLDRWKTTSRIQLLTARWMKSEDPQLESEIMELLRERQQADLERVKAERERLVTRLERLDQQIAKASSEDAPEKVWEKIRKQVRFNERVRRQAQSDRALKSATATDTTTNSEK